MRILALSGSLRAASTNSSLLRAMQGLAPEGIELMLYDGLADLPAFNPDIEAQGSAPAVQRFRDALASAQAVLISSPEYAHGVPGSLKNALDWVVGTGEFVDKPVGLITIDPLQGRNFAQEQLHETLRVMSARLPEGADLRLPPQKRGQAPSPETLGLLSMGLIALMLAMEVANGSAD